MGRYRTGAIETGEACRIEMSYLLKHKFVVKGQFRQGTLSWNNDGGVNVICAYTETEKYLRLSYTITEKQTGKKYDYDYKIFLTTVPSNLGKGEIVYFICPVSGKRCRILYKAYGHHKWKSREAYQNRIYYSGQITSKLLKHPERYFVIKNSKRYKELSSKLYRKHAKLTYRGKPTAWVKELERMKQKMNEAQMKSASIFAMYF